MDATEALRDRIRKAPRDNGPYFWTLMTKACNGQCSSKFGPSEEEIKTVFGQEIASAIELFHRLLKQYRKHDIRELMEGEITEEKVKAYLDDNLNSCHIYNTLCLLIENWIEKNKKEIVDENLEKEICAAHDEKWIDQDHVTELYDDGHITSQKGGELYGWRSVFTFHPALLHNFKMKLPRKEGGENGRTYAILESQEVAVAFRDRMIALSNK